MKRFIAVFAAAAMLFCNAGPALAGAGGLFAPKPSLITGEMQQQTTKDYNTATACIKGRNFEPAIVTDYAKLTEANSAAGWNAAREELTAYKANATIVHDESVRLQAIYCPVAAPSPAPVTP